MLVYHISDFHYNFDYQAGTSNKCNRLVCCDAKAGAPKTEEEAAGKWGDYNCDTNPALIKQLNHTIARTGVPEFIIWTGDSVDHEVADMDPKVSTRGAVEISKDLDKLFESSIIFPVLGNHEFAPANIEDMSANDDEVINILAEAWSNWLTPEVKEEFINNTFFSYNSTTHPKSNQQFVRKMNGTRIISLNTQNCLAFNFELIGEDNDPGQELSWLENLLLQMEKDGEIGILIGHIPPGSVDCTHDVAARIKVLHDRFQHIIRLNLFGHTHFEEFEVVRSYFENKPIGTSHVTSSFTTFLNQNPSIRAITLDVATKLPVKIETYTVDLVKANNDDDFAEFFLAHEFAEEYGVKDLSPNSMLEISNSFLEDETQAIKYKVNMLAGGRGSEEYKTKGCDEKCRWQIYCTTSHSDYRESRNCYKPNNIGFIEILTYAFDFIQGVWVIKN
mmetsp:Transcript_12579/g.11112  ORF Transcript_12579/g.11112 Transcript_12579/m.11112 type:complete len:446 (+) Transcript_12579:480-1817(+)